MGKTADLAVVQKTIIDTDTLHKEGKSQKVITERGGCSQSAVSKHIKAALCNICWQFPYVFDKRNCLLPVS